MTDSKENYKAYNAVFVSTQPVEMSGRVLLPSDNDIEENRLLFDEFIKEHYGEQSVITLLEESDEEVTDEAFEAMVKLDEDESEPVTTTIQ